MAKEKRGEYKEGILKRGLGAKKLGKKEGGLKMGLKFEKIDFSWKLLCRMNSCLAFTLRIFIDLKVGKSMNLAHLSSLCPKFFWTFEWLDI